MRIQTTKGGTIRFKPVTLATPEQLENAKRIVNKQKKCLWDAVAAEFPGHVWLKKNKDFIDARRLFEKMDYSFAAGISPSVADVIAFCILTHDLGRAIELLQKARIRTQIEYPVGYYEHGRASRDLLKLWGVLDCFCRETADIVGSVLENHTLGKLPMRHTLNTPVGSWHYLIACVVYDIDKAGLQTDKLFAWTTSEAAMQKEVKVAASYNINIRTKGRVTRKLVDDFKRHKTIDRREIKSRGDYILMQVSILFSYNLPETAAYVMRKPGVACAMRYLKRIVPAKRYRTVKRTLDRFVESCDLQKTYQ